MTVLNVYPDHSRPCSVTVYYNGAIMDFVTVSKMVMTFEESAVVADSSLDGSLIDWSTGDGVVIFNFSSLGLDPGLYNGTLYAYDSGHPDGQPVITKEDGNLLQFNVVGENEITLIVEDGSNVIDANTYANIQMARAYANSRPGLVFPVDNNEVAKMLISGMDYIESKACDYQGEPTYENQSLSWPRKCVFINCQLLAEDVIPKQLIAAQIQLAMAINSGVDIFPNVQATDFIIEETVGPITTKYSDPTKVGYGDLSPQLTAVNASLAQLFQSCQKQSYSLMTRRV